MRKSRLFLGVILSVNMMVSACGNTDAANQEKSGAEISFNAYLDIISDYKANVGNNTDAYLGYALEDLNEDGLSELLILNIDDYDNDTFYGSQGVAIYTIQDEEPVLLMKSDDYDFFDVLEDNSIYRCSFRGYSFYNYRISQIKDGEFADLVDITTIYNDEGDSENTWTTYDKEGNVTEKKEVTEEEADRFFDNLTRKNVELTPLQNMTEDDIRNLTGALADTYIWPDCLSWDYYLADSELKPGEASISLKQISATANDITDQYEWFDNNGLDMWSNVLFAYWYDREMPYDLQPFNTESYLLMAELEDDHYIYGLYGDSGDYGYRTHLISLYDKEDHSYIKTLNLCDFMYPPEYAAEDQDFVKEYIHYVHSEDGVLFVSMGHNTYASSASQNAYVMAFNIESGELLWKSTPLVSNAGNFAVLEDAIICGYGFTDEPDYLYILDKTTGAVQGEIKVKSGPDYIVEKDGKLYVRTYNMDYVFDIVRN